MKLETCSSHPASTALLLGLILITTSNSAIAQSLDGYRVACTTDQNQKINTALSMAKDLLNKANAALPAINSRTGGKYRRWFGGPDGDNDVTIKAIFFEGMTFVGFKRFWCPNASFPDDDAGTFAFVPTDGAGVFGEIFVAAAFFDAPTTGVDSQAGTVIHELTHLSKKRAVDDLAYGTTDAMALAARNPVDARKNADNFQYFVEDLAYDIVP